jgi:hypothetical protein
LIGGEAGALPETGRGVFPRQATAGPLTSAAPMMAAAEAGSQLAGQVAFSIKQHVALTGEVFAQVDAWTMEQRDEGMDEV